MSYNELTKVRTSKKGILMSKNRPTQLLEYMVKKSDTWVTGQQLANKFAVSTRQIRKYIAVLNELRDGGVLVESGPKGYYLRSENYFSYRENIDRLKADVPQTRQNYIMQKLITNQKGYDVFDFQEELCVSLATIEHDLTGVRKTLSTFELTLKRDKDNITLIGNEQNKRSLMRNMIMPDSYNFALNDEVQLLTLHYHFWDLRKNILRILVHENDLFTNDYTLNNIALHVIVMIERIRDGATLEHSEYNAQLFKNSEQHTATKQLSEYLSCTYHVQINHIELYYLLVTISNNTTMIDHNMVNRDNINQFVDKKYIDIGERVLRKVVQTYHLDPFDDMFKVRFVIHVNNLFTRLENQYLVKNPLTNKLKGAYPLIYDIAVFIAQEFENDYSIHLSEDEIAFISLHIGGYFENNLNNKGKVSCIFIYTDYYGAYKKVVEKIVALFSDTIHFKHIISLNQYQQETFTADLIISTIDMEFRERNVIVEPFCTDKNMESIRKNVNYILQNNKCNTLTEYLYDFIKPSLFYSNPDFANREEAIEIMTKNAISHGFAHDTLTSSVLQRESLSDTSFHGVAIPHSLREDVRTGFLSFAICEKPISWGDKLVHIIVLIGVNKDSRKVFTYVFDILVEVLSELQNVKELSKTAKYDEFLKKLILLTKNAPQ